MSPGAEFYYSPPKSDDPIIQKLDHILSLYFGGPSNYDELRSDLRALLAEVAIEETRAWAQRWLLKEDVHVGAVIDQIRKRFGVEEKP